MPTTSHCASWCLKNWKGFNVPRICYIPKTFSAEHASLIVTANKICAEYEAQGFKLTLRQLYYQFVARAIIPNTMQSYKRLGGVINDGRLAGEIDWDAIEDRTRNLEKLSAWDSPADIIQACARQFRYDRWATQEHRCEVWVEKEALVGVISPVCDELRVPYFACRGYTSQSEAWAAGRRFAQYQRGGQAVTVFHLGDHDPSGIDMTRDNRDRVEMFAGHGVTVKRLALNENQVRQYNPPPNPAKLTDSRAEGYIARFGDESWELDALEPRVISDLIRTNVNKLIDGVAWANAIEREREARDRIQETADNWED
jgi:hypothetical protein